MAEEVISNDYGISETFNKFFANIVPNLKITPRGNFVLYNMKQKIQYRRQ